MGNTETSKQTVLQGKPNQKPAAGFLMVSDLGWSAEELKETRVRLATWEEDWDAPGMEAYDCL